MYGHVRSHDAHLSTSELIQSYQLLHTRKQTKQIYICLITYWCWLWFFRSIIPHKQIQTTKKIQKHDRFLSCVFGPCHSRLWSLHKSVCIHVWQINCAELILCRDASKAYVISETFSQNIRFVT